VPRIDNENNDFVNGTIGTITALDEEGRIEVETTEGGKKRKIDVPRIEWEIVRYRAGGQEALETEVIGSFYHYPLKLAWAITIHKSQGKTFDKVLIDLGGGAFEHGQLYVALSRCRTLEGIILRHRIRPQDLITDPRILDFYNNLQS
jgi:ATP-dependent exoDNAse (exonuclease V) alpha subunit